MDGRPAFGLGSLQGSSMDSYLTGSKRPADTIGNGDGEASDEDFSGTKFMKTSSKSRMTTSSVVGKMMVGIVMKLTGFVDLFLKLFIQLKNYKKSNYFSKQILTCKQHITHVCLSSM